MIQERAYGNLSLPTDYTEHIHHHAIEIEEQIFVIQNNLVQDQLVLLSLKPRSFDKFQ